jgi:hypothetical protein
LPEAIFDKEPSLEETLIILGFEELKRKGRVA